MSEKFIVKKNNGAWKVFDTQWYGDVAAFQTEEEAKRHCDRLNGRIV